MFKACPFCDHIWHSREEFLSDDALILEGYQAHFDDALQGLFLFTHDIAGCGTTLATEVSQFVDLWHEQVIHEQPLTHDAECPRHCFSVRDLSPCNQPCQFGQVREILQEVRVQMDRTRA